MDVMQLEITKMTKIESEFSSLQSNINADIRKRLVFQ